MIKISTSDTLFIDSDILIAILNGKINLEKIQNTFNNYKYLATTSINIYELYAGYHQWMYSKNKVSEVKLKKEKVGLNSLISKLKVFSFSSDAAIKGSEVYYQLIHNGKRIELFDCLTAGIIITSQNFEILTMNIKHFERIEGITPISI